MPHVKMLEMGRRIAPTRSIPIAAAIVALFLVIGSASFPQDAAHARRAAQGDAAAPLTPRLIFAGQLQQASSEWHVIQIENTGGAAATVRADWYNLAGSAVGSGHAFSSALAPGASLEYGTAGEVPEGFRGTLIVSSDQPLAGDDTVYRVIGGVTSVAGRTGLLTMPGSTGSIVSVPYVSNRLGDTYNTNIHIANAGNATACVQVRYSFVPGQGTVPAAGSPPVADGGPGGGGCASGYPLAVDGSMTISPDAATGLTPYPAATLGTLMAATVTATGSGVVVVVDASLSTGLRKAAAYEGFLVSSTPAPGLPSNLGTDIAIPVALKTNDGYYSQILMSNPNDTAANVSLAYSSGGSTHTTTMTIPAGGVMNHSVYADNVVPLGFIGAARVTSDKPISAVVFRSKMTTAGSFQDEDLYTAVNGSVAGSAAKTLYLPTLFRRIGSDGSHAGMNTWLSITVPGGGDADLTLKTVSHAYASGGLSCPDGGTLTTTKHISGSFVFYQNADSDNGLGANPACIAGSMTITSSAPVLAVSSFITDLIGGDQEANYQVRADSGAAAPAAPTATATSTASASPSPSASASPAAAPAFPDPSMIYRLQTQELGAARCLDGNETGAGASMAICGTFGSQLWRFVPLAGGSAAMSPVWPGDSSCLEGNKVAPSSDLGGASVVYACSGVTGMSWHVVSGATGYYQLQNDFLGNGVCLEGNAAPVASQGNAPIFMRTCGTGNAQGQQWKLVPLSPPAYIPHINQNIAVRYADLGPGDSSLRQVSKTGWLAYEPSQNKYYPLTELSRDDWSVYLHDARGPYLQIDIFTNQFKFRDNPANPPTSTLPIGRASTAGPGYFVKSVSGSDNGTPYTLTQTAARQWTITEGGSTIAASEIARDDWSVTLQNNNGTAHVDLMNGIVTQSTGAPNATITSSTY